MLSEAVEEFIKNEPETNNSGTQCSPWPVLNSLSSWSSMG